MLIYFKQFLRALKFIGLLKFEASAHFSVHIIDEAVFYYFHCDVNYLLSDKKPSIRDVYYASSFDIFMPRLKEPHPATPKKLLETKVRIPSRRGYAMPLFSGCFYKYSMKMYAIMIVMLSLRKENTSAGTENHKCDSKASEIKLDCASSAKVSLICEVSSVDKKRKWSRNQHAGSLP